MIGNIVYTNHETGESSATVRGKGLDKNQSSAMERVKFALGDIRRAAKKLGDTQDSWIQIYDENNCVLQTVDNVTDLGKFLRRWIK